MKRTAKTIIGLVGVVAVAAIWSACSASDDSPKTGSTAGAPGAGGAPPAAGGAPGAGGDTTASQGGAPPAAGGAPGAGGDTSSVGGAPPAAGGAPPAAGGAPGAGGDTTASQGGAPGAGGATATGCTPTVTIPFAVADKFGPGATNGIWGNWGAVKFGTCSPARASATAVGKCVNLTYTSPATTGSDCTGAAIDAGTYCNWTAVAWHVADPGLCIAPGATKVTFQAWGTGVVGFGAGGASIAAQTLTATPTPYTLDLTTSATPYAGTPTATGFTITFADANGPATVNVDDIKWIQ